MTDQSPPLDDGGSADDTDDLMPELPIIEREAIVQPAEPAPGTDKLDRLARRVRRVENSLSDFLRHARPENPRRRVAPSETPGTARLPVSPEAGRLRVPWGDLGADRLQREWDLLIAWVSWLVRAYSVADWPACWAEHEGLVAQIDGLRRWHQAVYAADADDGAKITAWHDALYRLLPIVRAHSLCRAGADRSAERAEAAATQAMQVRDDHVAARSVAAVVTGGPAVDPDVTQGPPDL